MNPAFQPFHYNSSHSFVILFLLFCYSVSDFYLRQVLHAWDLCTVQKCYLLWYILLLRKVNKSIVFSLIESAKIASCWTEPVTMAGVGGVAVSLISYRRCLLRGMRFTHPNYTVWKWRKCKLSIKKWRQGGKNQKSTSKPNRLLTF